MEIEVRSEKLSTTPEGAVEVVELISRSTWGAVRTLWERGMAKKAIARELDVDIKTVRKWCRKTWVAQRRPSRGRGLDRYRTFLEARAPEVGFNAMVLHRELAGQGYEGSYAAVAKYQGRRGRALGRDHHRWPNAFFAEQGLFSFFTAYAQIRQPSRR